ncbi:MAG: 16S rRNA (uracil(1498)-N(3))-methyltransferase [Oscillospiraceae bacterium]|nr:16S rRNA (uracil(1498)-N(3))-methyltransferase [Oscillospiraceae bacterium]
MPRFFAQQADPDQIVLTGEDARHIGYSLRMRPGEMLIVCSGGLDYHCEITKITESEVFLHPVRIVPCASEPDIFVTLYQAIPKQDKLAEIIQKSVELGVFRIVPVLTSRCVSRPSQADFEKKRQRLQKIALSAAKQSGRGIIPEVGSLLTWKDMLRDCETQDLNLMLYEQPGGMSFRDALGHPASGARISLFVGSEGGISPEESEAVISAGFRPIWLGSRILRCETAPTAALSILMHLTGNM